MHFYTSCHFNPVTNQLSLNQISYAEKLQNKMNEVEFAEEKENPHVKEMENRKNQSKSNFTFLSG